MKSDLTIEILLRNVKKIPDNIEKIEVKHIKEIVKKYVEADTFSVKDVKISIKRILKNNQIKYEGQKQQLIQMRGLIEERQKEIKKEKDLIKCGVIKNEKS